MTSKIPELSVNYTKREKDDPIIDLALVIDGKEHPVKAYADTGCSSALSITKRIADELGLKPENAVNDEPLEAILADGTLVGCSVYKVKMRMGNIEKYIWLPVVDPDIKLGKSDQEDADEPLLGREILDDFDVLFASKSNPKKLEFY